jgi:hypothetical protein
MINFDFRIKVPDLEFETPAVKDWRAIGINETKEIRKRTEDRGKDYEQKGFKSYTKAYEDYRAASGRSRSPNLSFSGRMLGAMAKGIRPHSNMVKIILTGEEAIKAFGNEKRGRTFFSISKKRADEILKGIDIWLAKKNDLT